MIANDLKDKNACVMLVLSSATVRNQHRDVLREMGISKVVGASDLPSAMEVLEAEPIDWIITPICADQSVNAFALLKLIIATPSLRNVKITMIVDEGDERFLEDAYDLGLLCHFRPKTSHNEIHEEYAKFFKILDQKRYNTTKVSAIYLREILKEKPLEQLNFFKKLAQVFPGDPSVLIDLARAYFVNKKKQNALILLKQVLFINPKLKDEVEALAQEYMTMEPAQETIESQNTLGVAHCVIVDPDQAVLDVITGLFTQVGMPIIKCFKTANDLLAYPDLKQVDLLILDWSLRDIASPILVQKLIFEKSMVSIPIITMSNGLAKNDLPLLRELGIINYIQKPLEQGDFFKKIIWSLQQQLLPSEPGTIELKIRQHLNEGNLLKAKGLFAHYKLHKDVERSRINQFEAEFAYYDAKYFVAKTKCLQAIREGGDSVFVLSLLGKVLMKLRDFSAALRCLDLAHSMSPLNLKRICAISECYMENDDLKNAQSTLNMAIEIDSEFEDVKQTQTKLNVLQGNVEGAKKLMGEISSVKDVISFMNNRAVSLAVCNRIQEGIELYRRTLESIPDNRTDLSASVHYNLAIAFAREKNLQAAVEELVEAEKYKSKNMRVKIKSLVERMKASIKTGSEFKLKSPMVAMPISDEVGVDDMEEALKEMAIKRGEICCHKIFIKVPYSKEVIAWTKNKVNFSQRSAIQRGGGFEDKKAAG